MHFGSVKLNDGNEIPAIGFGSGSVNKGRDATDLVCRAIEAGFSHIDTAQAYRNEDGVGEAIRESGLARNEVFVTTKYSSGVIQDTFSESLDKLGLKYVDLYLIHHPEYVAPDLEGSWKILEKFKDDGLTKSIGVSNFGVEHLQTIIKIARIKPAVNQIEFHPYTYARNKPLLAYCAKHGIVIEAYSSLAPITKFPGGPVDAPINAAAKRLGITSNQVIFAWVKAKGAVIVTTSSKKERLEEYLAVGDLPPLTKEEILAIDEAGAKGPENRAKLQDVKESFESGLEGDEAMPNIWLPEDVLPGFKDACLDFFSKGFELQEAILKALAVAFDLPEDYFVQFHTKPDNQLRLLHYPSVPLEVLNSNKITRINGHSDFGSITIVFQDDVGGLEVEDPNRPGSFVPVPPVPGSIIVNAGDFLMRWSNDIIRSTIHRVRAPTGPASADGMVPERCAIPYFVCPDFSTVIDAIPGTWSDERPKRYEPISAAGYVLKRLAANY
ncbi:hypothetical protein C0991_009347 [Blastosporella zonata]|nr:hypothetical protein C0991_009347 [Blastosporella zonata]